MVVMSFIPRGQMLWRMRLSERLRRQGTERFLGLGIEKWIGMQRDRTRASRFGKGGQGGIGSVCFNDHAALAAKFVAHSIAISARAADHRAHVVSAASGEFIGGQVARDVLRGLLGVVFGREALRGFERCGDRIGSGLGSTCAAGLSLRLLVFVHEIYLRDLST